MNYSVQLLTTVENCDLVIEAATMERSELEFKKYSLEKKRNTSTNNTAAIEAEIPAVLAEISAYETVLLTLPEGEAKEGMEAKLVKAKYKLFLLQQKRASYGVIAVLGVELEIGSVEASIAEIVVYIAAVNARKAGL
ncbi:hypothetical protein [Ferruginibacter sp. HRS2-29]|uniref:hypothetical protein n=1 Tax=Ferruginibacter sp. HRS2-29 TaxID=2487334 RepID=UPI0020CE9A8D|nr:hypothetical protein [Ferruginibacter sp. HRS2-29]MCP9749483.1 hypothetical protein [Ferruginibacter sp. HRS2-29]